MRLANIYVIYYLQIYYLPFNYLLPSNQIVPCKLADVEVATLGRVCKQSLLSLNRNFVKL